MCQDVFIHAIPGHYVTASAHLNYYVGTSDIKHNRVVSVEAAKLLAEYYSVRNMDVDTVLCLYETQALGAYMAQELASPSMLAPNPDLQVYVLGPEYDTQGNMIFRDNLRRMIQGKNVVVLISCITSGRTVERAVQSARYYGGNVIGISSVFSAAKELCGLEVNTLFTPEDLPNYSYTAAKDTEYTVPTKDCEAEKDLRFPAQRGGGRCKPHREHRCIALCGVALLNRNQ